MLIIISRKGFDSSSGSVPSPIFPDGKMLSLPIPDEDSMIRYKDIRWNKHNVGDIIMSLTKGKISSDLRAHLDPDLNRGSIPRDKKWKPIFGQIAAAQGHLRNQNIGPGDLFLFFGLFREIVKGNSGFRYKAGSKPKHIIWGWLQTGEIVPVHTCDKQKYAWASYHPHFHKDPDKSNTLYIAKKYLNIPGIGDRKITGASVFEHYSSKLQLTDEASLKPSLWKLPKWFYPSGGKPPLTYHPNMSSWHKKRDHSLLQSAAKGQEFVLDCRYYPEAIEWINSLIGCRM